MHTLISVMYICLCIHAYSMYVYTYIPHANKVCTTHFINQTHTLTPEPPEKNRSEG